MSILWQLSGPSSDLVGDADSTVTGGTGDAASAGDSMLEDEVLTDGTLQSSAASETTLFTGLSPDLTSPSAAGDADSTVSGGTSDAASAGDSMLEDEVLTLAETQLKNQTIHHSNDLSLSWMMVWK